MRILIFLLSLQAVEHHRSNVPPMSLAEIEAEALENNREIAVMRQRVEFAKAGVIPATAVDDPSFMYRAWSTPLLQPWNVNRTQHMFMYTQTLPGSGKRELRYQAATEGIAMAEADLEANKLDIAARVRAAFYELLRNNDELRLHEEQIALARQAAAAARIKYTVGSVPQQDVLKGQIALARLADHLTMFLQEGDLARARLNTLMGRDASAPLEVAGAYVPPAPLPAVASLQQSALDHRPELRSVQAAIRQSETEVRLAEKGYKPDLTLGAGYMVMPSGSMNRNGYMAEVSVNLPWLNRSKHDAEIRESQSRVNVRRAEVEAQKSLIFREIQEALIRVNSAARLIELYRDTLRPQAQATLRAASAAYQTDQTDFLNLIDSQNTMLEVEYAYYRSMSEFDSRIGDLERAIGAPLPRSAAAGLEASHDAQ